jgi:hypothetical protein
MSDRVFYNLKAFVDQGPDKKKKVVDVGYLYANDKGGFNLKLIATPVAGWDGSLVAELPKPKEDDVGFP